jgi:uncharacterized caspase-like protein
MSTLISGVRPAVLLAMLLLVPFGEAASKDKRIALVIGNSDYVLTSVWPKLVVPKNDAAAMSRTLRNMGFDVDRQIDLKRDAVDAAIVRLQQSAKDASVVIVYYAGHGITYDHVSYIVPTDAGIPNTAESLAAELYSVQTIVTRLESDSRIVLLLLDACRENLLVQRLTADPDPQAQKLTTRLSRGMGHILDGITGPVKPEAMQSAIEGGLYLVYATTPGGVALDGDTRKNLAQLLESGSNSPFTAALLEHIGEPVEIQQVMTEVRFSVQSRTSGLQLPTAESTLLHPFYLVTQSEFVPVVPPVN